MQKNYKKIWSSLIIACLAINVFSYKLYADGSYVPLETNSCYIVGYEDRPTTSNPNRNFFFCNSIRI